jgi:hypothetical protein
MRMHRSAHPSKPISATAHVAAAAAVPVVPTTTANPSPRRQAGTRRKTMACARQDALRLRRVRSLRCAVRSAPAVCLPQRAPPLPTCASRARIQKRTGGQRDRREQNTQRGSYLGACLCDSRAASTAAQDQQLAERSAQWHAYTSHAQVKTGRTEIETIGCLESQQKEDAEKQWQDCSINSVPVEVSASVSVTRCGSGFVAGSLAFPVPPSPVAACVCSPRSLVPSAAASRAPVRTPSCGTVGRV